MTIRKITTLDVANYVIKYYKERQTQYNYDEIYQRLNILVYFIHLYLIRNNGPYLVDELPLRDTQGPYYRKINVYLTKLKTERQDSQHLSYLEDEYSNLEGYRFNPRCLDERDQEVINQTVQYLEGVPTHQLIGQTVDKELLEQYKGTQIYYTLTDINTEIKRYYST